MNAGRVRATATMTLAAVGLFAVARPARAHIKMTAPADWLTTSSEGDPQKVAPCGVDPSTQPGPNTYTLSNKVTTVHAGDQLTVAWTETVPHDGHFRIALALQSRDELKDPVVTSYNADQTPAAVTISMDYPVLADNLFPHKASDVQAGHMYTTTVTIPASASCTKCTLQLIQFMSEHPADPTFFYHHCADLQIQGGAGNGGAGGGAKGGAGGAAAAGGHAGSAAGGGGAPGTGGVASTGGASGTGGALGSGGAPATGGASGTGGLPGTGGVLSTGGASASGGTSGTGGSPAGDGSGGCSCQTAPGLTGGLGLALLALSAALLRRRRA